MEKHMFAKKDLKVVGTGYQRVDAESIVNGTAIYTADYSFPRMIYAKTLRSKYPHAKILGIDTTEARTAPGVLGVVTADDILGLNQSYFGVHPQLILFTNLVKSEGDALAVVAAETEQQAEAALAKIKVKYDPLPAVFDPFEAMKDSAPQLDVKGNVGCQFHTTKGDVKAGFDAADLVLERSYQTQHIDHAYLEPEAVIAVPEGDTMTVYISSHYPHQIRVTIANALNYPLSKVTVVTPIIGGAFGGKAEHVSLMGARVALLALKTNRPVKMVYSREESMIESAKRHPYYMKYKIGVSNAGKILALQCECVADSGAHLSATPYVLFRSHVHATGPYEIPNVQIDSYGVLTNKTFSASMRGFGAPQVNFASESLMDEVALKLKMDPIDFRLLNAFEEGSVTATGQTLTGHTVSIKAILRRAKDLSDWMTKRVEFRKKDPPSKRGIGIACSYRGVSFGGEGIDYGASYITVQKDGSVTVSCGVTDVGQGARTVFTQLAAESLGINPDNVRCLRINTDTTPDMLTTSASRGTLTGGNAVLDALSKIKIRMADVAAEYLGTEPSEIVFTNGLVKVKNKPKKALKFGELTRICFGKMVNLSEIGWFISPKVTWDGKTGQGSTYFTFTYQANVAEVEITDHSKIKVNRIYALHDSGRIINPIMAKGQIYGGLSWAVGFALSEEVKFKDGHITTLNFNKYRLTRAREMPEVIIEFIENPDPFGPYGAKGIAEQPTEIGAPAIANAVYHVTENRLRRLPLNLTDTTQGAD